MINSVAPRLPARTLQRGYLLEIPLLIATAPVLPPVGQKVLLCLVAAAIMFGLYYMVVVPGWMPGDKARLRPPWNRVVFLALAAVVVAVTVAILSGMQN